VIVVVVVVIVVLEIVVVAVVLMAVVVVVVVVNFRLMKKGESIMISKLQVCNYCIFLMVLSVSHVTV
jgi:hypothetical protein